MKLVRHDRQSGTMKVRIDTHDDLWVLRNLLAVGDLVTASTHRTAETSSDKIRAEKAEKKRMTLGVRVESVEWHDFDDHLRVLGVIETGPQDHGRHHTLILRPDQGDECLIEKRDGLKQWHLDQVKQAAETSATPQVVLLAIDDTEAQFAVLRGHGIQWLGSLPSTGQGKAFAGAAEAKKKFYEETAKSLATLRTASDVPCVVVGPGWWREEFLSYLGDKHAELARGIATDGTSQGGRGGIQEALRRGQVQRVSQDHRVSVETAKVEAVFEQLARPDGLAAVGPDEVRKAVQLGAAEEVLMTDVALREGGMEDILKLAEETRCGLHVVASGHDAGARLSQLSGVAALLRFAT